jgi:DNA-binding IclR family transcriptional regulator
VTPTTEGHDGQVPVRGAQEVPVAGNSTEVGRSVTSKITSILMTFTEGSEHSLTEIAQLARLPVSTAHRLTAELAAWRLLERTENGLYRAGLPLRMMGTAGHACAPTLQERAPCVLEDLAAATRRRARLGVLRELEVSYIEKQPGPRPVSAFAQAATLPAHPTALGRALLAFGPACAVEMTIMRGLRPYTPHTVTSPDRFRRALAVTRLTRVAVTRWEFEIGAAGVAMPVFGPGGDAVAAIELTVRRLGHELQPVMPALAVAARSLSRELAGEAHREQAERPAVPDVLPRWLVEDRVDRARERAVTVEAGCAP